MRCGSDSPIKADLISSGLYNNKRHEEACLTISRASPGIESAFSTKRTFPTVRSPVHVRIEVLGKAQNSTCLYFKSIVYYIKKGKKTQRPLLRGSIQPDIRSVTRHAALERRA